MVMDVGWSEYRDEEELKKKKKKIAKEGRMILYNVARRERVEAEGMTSYFPIQLSQFNPK